ncbi:TROVE domain-containing protein [Xanthocytophaga agilis]|uniref:TROVE domain-containing protein n=1 Tax=Xanthocytophaga agilis TaxID=3048010 RepID=A0AAE3RBG0_9BACT|nr:TROVE domain-containing protein [Xanthocytophaga agilis]MDJ1505135.1 TROVE domain-containing protein [Xanthocytophaga agilis]
MKFNILTKNKNQIVNHEGAPAYTITSELELYSAVVTSSLSDQFYEKADQKIDRIRILIQKVDPVFVAQLAVYARERMHLRSIPLVLAVELVRVHSGDQLVSKMVSRIIQRADEITELLAYYQAANRRDGIKKLGKLSKQLQRGIALAFNKFDEYQFAKYNREAEVKLRDALFLVHPKAKDETQQLLFDKIVNDGLTVPYTWEVELSALGQQSFENEATRQAAVKAKWEELIDSGKLGYMALLRNLRNILQATVSEQHINRVADRLANEREVKNSKQLPFRFLAAYRELKEVNTVYTSLILNALEDAVKVSAANIKGFDINTKVLLACDVSGSMQTFISPRSRIQNYDIGLILAMLLQSRSKSVISGFFGDRWKVVNLASNHILANTTELRRREGEVGYATNGHLVIQDLIDKGQVVDKVMFFTDCQLWNSKGDGNNIAKLWGKYKQIAPNAKIYLFDLAGYGQMPLRTESNDVFMIAGWSDKVFDILEAIENGSNAVAEIEKIIL